MTPIVTETVTKPFTRTLPVDKEFKIMTRVISKTVFVVVVGLFGLLAGHAKANVMRGVWLFDEGSGSTAYDASGYHNAGAISGATYSTDTPFSYAGNRSLYFNGTSDYVETPYSASLQPSAFTLLAWVKFDTPLPNNTDNSRWEQFVSTSGRLFQGWVSSTNLPSRRAGVPERSWPGYCRSSL